MPLMLMFPEADVPVVELSILASLDAGVGDLACVLVLGWPWHE